MHNLKDEWKTNRSIQFSLGGQTWKENFIAFVPNGLSSTPASRSLSQFETFKQPRNIFRISLECNLVRWPTQLDHSDGSD